MINLKEQGVKGATVHFRCGGSATIQSISGSDVADYSIKFEESCNIIHFKNNGIHYCGVYHLLDIIRIDPPAFDWSTAKAGMAFKHTYGDTMYYMGDDIGEEYVTVAKFKKVRYHKDCLTRIPEHDIEVKHEE